MCRRAALLLLPLLTVVTACGSDTASPPPTILPTRLHIRLGAVYHSSHEVGRIQTGASEGTASLTRYLNPVWVATSGLPRLGVDTPFQIYPPVQVAVDEGRLRYGVLLTQPARSGNTGVWLISAIIPLPALESHSGHGRQDRRHAVTVSHSAPQIQHIQAGADRGDPQYTFYRNPIQVVARTLPQLGFHKTARIEPRLELQVMKGVESYDVTLTQPARKGLAGIWLISAVQNHQGGVDGD